MSAPHLRDRGSITLELAILIPAFLLMFALIMVGGRLVLAHSAVDQASSAAARAASISRTESTARQAATTAASDSLAQQNVHCSDVAVDVDTSAFAVPVGQSALVVTTVTCTVDLSSLGLPGLPGSKTMTGRSASALDRYRSR